MFRKPIPWQWHVGLGAASIVLPLVVYTTASWIRQSDDPDDMLLPNWGQLWNLGVVRAFTPERTNTVHLSDSDEQLANEAKKTLEELQKIGDQEPLRKQYQQLAASLKGKLPPDSNPNDLLGKQGLLLLSEDVKALEEKRSRTEKDLVIAGKDLVRLRKEERLGQITPEAARERSEALNERIASLNKSLPEIRSEFWDKQQRLDAARNKLQSLAGHLSPELKQTSLAELRGWQRLATADPQARDNLDNLANTALQSLPAEEQRLASIGLAVQYELYRRAEEDREIWRIPLIEDIKSTFGRVFLGLAIALLASLALGILMGCYAPVEAFFYPPLAILAKIPGTAMLPLFFVIVGLNFQFYQAMILFGLIPTLTQSIYYYVKDVPEELLFKARTLGASPMECIWNVILPSIRPKVMEALRLSVGPALIFLYAAEYVYGDYGLGCRLRIITKKGIVESPTAYFYLAIIALFGFSIDYALRWSQRKLSPWYYQQ